MRPRRGGQVTLRLGSPAACISVIPGAYSLPMPRYEFRCRACGDTFEVSRPMSEAAAPAACPEGHDDTVKLLSTVAVARAGTAPSRLPSAGSSPAPAQAGGCCGGACGC